LEGPLPHHLVDEVKLVVCWLGRGEGELLADSGRLASPAGGTALQVCKTRAGTAAPCR
jgi:hypothetical protein